MRTIVFTPEAALEFEALDSTVKERVEAALDQLALAPLSLRNQIKRLKGQTGLRLRVEDLANHIPAQKRRNPCSDDRPSKRSVSLGAVR